MSSGMSFEVVPNGLSLITSLLTIFGGPVRSWPRKRGELEQIQFLLGHASVLTTERYLGCKQNLEEPVNDRFGSLFSLSNVEMR